MPTPRWVRARWRRRWSPSGCPSTSARRAAPPAVQASPEPLRPPVLAEAVLRVTDIGRIAYADAMRLQDQLVEERLADAIPDTLLLLEHPPVITLGRRATTQDVYASEARLAQLGVD